MANLNVVHRLQRLGQGDTLALAQELTDNMLSAMFMSDASQFYIFQSDTSPYRYGKSKMIEAFYNERAGFNYHQEGVELVGSELEFGDTGYSIDQPMVADYGRSIFDQMVDHRGDFDFTGSSGPAALNKSLSERFAEHLDMIAMMSVIRACRGHPEHKWGTLPVSDLRIGLSGYGNTGGTGILGTAPITVASQTADGCANPRCYRPELKLPNIVTPNAFRTVVTTAKRMMAKKSNHAASLSHPRYCRGWTLYVNPLIYDMLVDDAKSLNQTIDGNGSYTIGSLPIFCGLKFVPMPSTALPDYAGRYGKVEVDELVPNGVGNNERWEFDLTPPKHTSVGFSRKYRVENMHTTAALLVKDKETHQLWSPVDGIRTIYMDDKVRLSNRSITYGYPGGGIKDFANACEINFARPPRGYSLADVATGYNDAV